jgi:hypothetical protein
MALTVEIVCASHLLLIAAHQALSDALTYVCMHHINTVLLCICIHRLESLYLDTTYCNPQYTFPSQQQAIDATAQAIAVHTSADRSKSNSSILVLFGAYSLGKERLYMEVAKRLGKKVYVDKKRFQVMYGVFIHCLR